MKAKLILENGAIFEGKAFGHLKETTGEVVFNTGMTGYQEVLTDPSYYGQIVMMTYPLIGNYGINLDDTESDGIKVSGLIVREKCDNPSNWRCEFELEEYLKRYRVLGLEGIDTRALTKMIRDNGTMKGIITVRELTDSQIKSKLENINNIQAVSEVTLKDIKKIEGSKQHIAVLDFGIKNSILNSLINKGYKLTVFPAATKAEEILKINPDSIFLSNGPGNPKDLKDIINEIKELIGKKPIRGVGLGHQLIALALGGDTEKLSFGHRGVNYPVKDLRNNKVLITSQNHGFVVKKDSLKDNIEITHINVNDKTIEGIRHKEYDIYSIQFYPESFDEFLSFYNN